MPLIRVQGVGADIPKREDNMQAIYRYKAWGVIVADNVNYSNDSMPRWDVRISNS